MHIARTRLLFFSYENTIVFLSLWNNDLVDEQWTQGGWCVSTNHQKMHSSRISPEVFWFNKAILEVVLCDAQQYMMSR